MAQLGRPHMGKTLQASTLLETLVASVIIIGCFGVSLMIFEQVLNSSNSANETKADLELRNEMIGSSYESTMVIETTLNSYGHSNALLLLTSMAVDTSGQVISERQTLIPKAHE